MTSAYPFEHVGEPAEAPVDPTPDEVAEGRRIRALLDPEPTPGRRSAAPWRVAGALEVLRAEANACNPKRDRASDGTIGNAAHAARASDHNPNAAGVVRAVDLDVDGLPLAEAFERIRQLAAAGKLPQVRNGGYLILNRRITRPDWSGWNAYTGPNPHTSHGHASAATAASAYDNRAPWGVFTHGKEPDDMDLRELVEWRPVQFDGARRSLFDSANQTLANIGALHGAVIAEGAKDAARDGALLEALKAVGTGGVDPARIVAAAREAAQQELANAAEQIAAAVLSAQERAELERLRARIAELEGRGA